VTDTRLYRLLWLSIAAAVATISPKVFAWSLTGSVGLLSDAAESVVNLVAAVVAMLALRWSVKPADEGHAYGHAKAEYFSAWVEEALIFARRTGDRRHGGATADRSGADRPRRHRPRGHFRGLADQPRGRARALARAPKAPARSRSRPTAGTS
jgi:hypothetical protein